MKVLVAVSGGVDSAVSVHLLKEAGYEVMGVVMKMSPAHDATVEDARRAALQLDIPLTVADCTGRFDREVVSYFMNEYRSGRTPSPCVVCNPLVKFRVLAEEADRLGCEKIATGHYAGLRQQDGITLLTRGEDPARDQSYMLARLTQPVLSRLLLPLSTLSKDRVREIAAGLGLSCAAKPDSQEICFIPDGDYAAYIEGRAGSCPPGDFISPEGRPCGQHRGILHYTVGQRKKLGIALGRPVFIREIDPVSNRIYLADAGQEYAGSCTLSGLSETFPRSLSGAALPEGMAVEAKIRSRAPLAAATLTLAPEGQARLAFETPQRAPAPGQLAVFYRDGVVLGGGFIDRAEFL